MKEMFRDIKNYEGIYKVSNLGSVLSLKRIDKNNRPILEKILKNTLDSNGYFVVCLHLDGIKKKCNVHQLVAMSFLNHKPCGFNKVVDHIDGNKLNNDIKNLKLVSHRENIAKGYRSKKTTSKYTGVSVTPQNKYRAIICQNGKNINLGTYVKEYDAHLAYQNSMNSELSILKKE